jgi:uncharacterized protein (UPF0276 family)
VRVLRIAPDRPPVRRSNAYHIETFAWDESGDLLIKTHDPMPDHPWATNYRVTVHDPESSLGARAIRSMTVLSRRRISA